MKMFDAGKTRMIGLPYGEKHCDDILSRFHLIPEHNGRTDRFAISISRVSMLTRDKNCQYRLWFDTVIAKIKRCNFSCPAVITKQYDMDISSEIVH